MAFDRLREVTAPAGSPTAQPCALLVFAHPDDEVVALGGRMGRFGDSHFVHVTDGAPRNELDGRADGFQHLDDYRRARREEFDRMLERAGIAEASRESSVQVARLAGEAERQLASARGAEQIQQESKR